MDAKEYFKKFMTDENTDGRYRKKPLEVNAFHWTGDFNQLMKWAKSVRLGGTYTFEHKTGFFSGNVLLIKTIKGNMKAKVGDWIIKGIKGEFYPVSNEIFKDTYEKI